MAFRGRRNRKDEVEGGVRFEEGATKGNKKGSESLERGVMIGVCTRWSLYESVKSSRGISNLNYIFELDKMILVL